MATAGQQTLLRELEGDECPHAPECSGTLERDEYKGDRAVICEECNTPVVRIW